MVLNPNSYKNCDDDCEHNWKKVKTKGHKNRRWRTDYECTKCEGERTYRNPSI